MFRQIVLGLVMATNKKVFIVYSFMATITFIFRHSMSTCKSGNVPLHVMKHSA